MAWLAAPAAALALAGLVASCRSPSGGITIVSYPQEQIIVHSQIFERWFQVSSCAVATNENGLLHATVSLQNIREQCQFEYRYRWLDADGIEVRTGTAIWTPQSSGPKEIKMLTGIAPNRDAASFILDIRFTYPSTRW